MARPPRLTLRSEDGDMKVRFPTGSLELMYESFLPIDKGRYKVKADHKVVVQGGVEIFLWDTDYLEME